MRTKDLSLEGLRGVASMSVVFAHFLFIFLPHLANYTRPHLSIPSRYQIEDVFAQPYFTVFFNGSFAVSIFFVMSGFVLTNQFYATGDAGTLRAGAIKRYPRLVIPVFGATMLAYGLYASGAMHNQLAGEIGTAGWPLIYYPKNIGFGAALFDGLFGTAFLGNLQLDGPLWTIRIEVLGSLILFATYGLFRTKSILLNTVVFCSLAVAVSASSPYIIHYVTIFVGSLLHYLTRRLRDMPKASLGFLALGVVFGAFDYSRVFAGIHKHLGLPDLPPPLFNLQTAEVTLFHSLGAVLLVAGLLGSASAAKVLSSRIPAYLGRISFSVYLLHWPIMMSLSYWLMGQLKVGQGWSYLAALATTALVTFPTIVAVSDLFERWVDRPAIRIANSFARFATERRVADQSHRSIGITGPAEVAFPRGVEP